MLQLHSKFAPTSHELQVKFAKNELRIVTLSAPTIHMVFFRMKANLPFSLKKTRTSGEMSAKFQHCFESQTGFRITTHIHHVNALRTFPKAVDSCMYMYT